MKTLTAACALSMMTMLFSACGREFTDRPEIKSEIEAMRNEGWSFIHMVGEAHSAPKAREIRRSDASGSLTVSAGNTGVDGYGNREQSFSETFKEEGFEFLEVKIMTSPADGYSLVFQRRLPSTDDSDPELIRNPTQEADSQTLGIKSEGESGKRAFLKVRNMKIWADRLSKDLPSSHVVLTGRVQILVGEGLLEEAYDDPQSSVTVDVTEGSIVKRTGRFHQSSLELGSSR